MALTIQQEHPRKLSVAEIRERLEQAEILASAPRIAIAYYVWQTTSHPTAERVKAEVESTFPQVSLATVYNTLKLFVQKGLLREVTDGHSDAIRYDCNTTPHYHFLDEETGEMLDLHPAPATLVPHFNELDKEFEINEVQVTIRGKKKKIFAANPTPSSPPTNTP